VATAPTRVRRALYLAGWTAALFPVMGTINAMLSMGLMSRLSGEHLGGVRTMIALFGAPAALIAGGLALAAAGRGRTSGPGLHLRLAGWATLPAPALYAVLVALGVTGTITD
jgi:hypothetical protein